MSEKPVDIGIDSKPKREQDKIDLNHEISGVPTGRRQRFLTQNDFGNHGEECKKQKAERRYHNLLEYLLAEDAQYAQLYYEVQDTLNQARRAAELAMNDINSQLEVSERALQLMRDNATRLDDGTLVFRSTVDGNIYTEDGRKLSSDEAKGIEFANNAPSLEDYKQAKSNVEAAQVQKAKVETYQRDIDHAQERLRDADNPLTIEELETIKRDISENSLFPRNSGMQQPICDTETSSVAQEICEDSNLNMPPMNSQFDKARLGIPDVETLPQFAKTQTVAPTL